MYSCCCFGRKSKEEKESKTGQVRKNMTLIYKKTRCVLVVDDDPSCRTLYMGIIQMAGGFPYMAKNGEEAVNLYREGETFNLILMDNEMPIMDGVSATKQLRDMGVKSMIVGLTSDEDDEDEHNAFMEAGADHCLAKPLTYEKIVSVLNLL